HKLPGTFLPEADRRKNRQIAVAEEKVEKAAVDAGHFADEAKAGIGLASREDGAVDARKADCVCPKARKGSNQLLIHQAGEDGNDNVDRVRAGNAQAIDEFAGNAVNFKPLGGGVAATVDHDDRPPGSLNGGDVFESCIVATEGAATDFDDEWVHALTW